MEANRGIVFHQFRWKHKIGSCSFPILGGKRRIVAMKKIGSSKEVLVIVRSSPFLNFFGLLRISIFPKIADLDNILEIWFQKLIHYWQTVVMQSDIYFSVNIVFTWKTVRRTFFLVPNFKLQCLFPEDMTDTRMVSAHHQMKRAFLWNFKSPEANLWHLLRWFILSCVKF